MTTRPHKNKDDLSTHKAYKYIERLVVTGDLASGDRLIEEDIALATNMSRTPVRDAIKQLQQAGVVERNTTGRIVVKPLDENDVDDIFTLRMMIEGHSAGLALDKITDAQIKALEAIVDKQEELLGQMDNDRFVYLDEQFHATLLAASRNSIHAAMMNILSSPMYRYRFTILRFYPNPAPAVKEHSDIVAALKDRDAKAIRQAIGRHIEHANGLLARAIRKSRQSPRF